MLELLAPSPRVRTTNPQAVCVIGLGRVGLPTATLLANQGIDVVGVDVNAQLVERINLANFKSDEPDLDVCMREAIATGHLVASNRVVPASAFMIAVPTPLEGRQPDLSHVRAACHAIAPLLERGNLVVLESTVPVGTTQQMSHWFAELRPDLTFPHRRGTSADVGIAFCPERILPGRAMRELVANDRVIGGLTPKCARRAAALYAAFVKGTCHLTDARTAELVKLTENSFRDINIAFANELSMVCGALSVDIWDVIGLANRHPRVDILRPGAGVGGHCVAVDPWLLAASAPGATPLIETARRVNDSKRAWVIEQVEAAIGAHLMANRGADMGQVSIACYGVAYKPDSDDLRESPALAIVQALAERHRGPVLVVEPHLRHWPDGEVGASLVSAAEAASADIHVMLVGHSAFRAIRRPAGRVIDVCGLWHELGEGQP